MDLVPFLGRLHPVVLHLPIGALFTVLVAELWLLRSSQFKDLRLLFVLYLFTFVSAALAVTTGLVLHEEDAYGGSILELHEQLGIATGGVVLLVAIFAGMALRAAGRSTGTNYWVGVRRFGLLVALGVVTLAGHYGGVLTHGKSFLSEYGPAFLREPEAPPQPVEITAETTVFEAAIHPIIENYCVYCHDDETTKGKLRMDSPEAMMAGGSSGPLFIPGDAANSRMLERIHLPLEHEDHMPPPEKRQPDEAAIEALAWWIESGASFEMELLDPQVPESIHALIEAGKEETDTFTPDGELDLAVVRELRDQLLTVQRIEQGENRLWISFSAIATTAGDDFLRQLQPLDDFVVWLDLARTQITDASMPVVASMPHLEELNLNASSITDAGLASLTGLEKLKQLNLTETSVSEVSLPALLQMESLEVVHLYRTGWSPEGIQVLRKLRPELTVNTGT